MHRRLAVVLALLCALALSAPSVAAKGPPIHDFYEPGGFEFAEGEVCADFAVGAEIVRGRAHDQIRELDDGTLHIRTTGLFIGRIVNRSTGVSVVRNFSGPVDTWIYPDGTGASRNRGHTLGWLTPAEGGPALWHHSGTIQWAISGEGLFSIVRETGTREDLCATLAG